MDAPLSYVILDGLRSNELREIDHHYHVECIANSVQDVVTLQRDMLRLNAAHALEHVRTMHHQSRQLDQIALGLADGFRDVVAGLDAVSSEVAGVRHAVTDLQDTLESGLANLQVAIEQGLAWVAEEVIANRHVLEQVSETLRAPLETKARELLAEGETWLHRGMARTGRDRKEDYDDAFRLLAGAAENPIGAQNCVVWFQLGWLQWRHKKDLALAEDAFYRSQRLSDESGAYYVRGVRHWAYMLYLRGDAEGAYQASRKMLASNEVDALYDCARYAARTGRASEARALLVRCLRERPDLSINVFAEEDFL